MRVHALIDSLRWGGAEMLLADLGAAAPAAEIDLSVGYLSARESEAAARLRRIGIEPQRIVVRRLLDPRALGAVRHQIASVAPDIVHTHLEYADILGGVAARSLGIPCISTLHVMRWEQDLRSRVRARLASLIRRRCAYRVVAVSDAASRTYVAQGWDSPDHVMTIRNGSAARPEAGRGAIVRRELGIAPDALVVGTLSVLRAGKGHDVVASAIDALRNEMPHLRLVVAGDGPARADVQQVLAPLGDAARMIGHREDVMAVLDAYDVLVHPSQVDAFPGCLIEAMSAGVPVVATRVGGIPEIVSDGETGVLLDSPVTSDKVASVLRPLLRDLSLRASLSARARERFARCFTVERWLEELISLYHEACSDRAT